MVLLLHPTGNSNVRETIKALDDSSLLHSFHTTLGISSQKDNSRLIKKILERRSYNIPFLQLKTHPSREFTRLLLQQCGLDSFLDRIDYLSIDSISKSLSNSTAKYLDCKYGTDSIQSIYAYEDSALEVFRKGKSLGMKCLYELPIAYWKHMHKLLSEENDRLPEWRPTLTFSRDSQKKLERKEEELELADIIFCPSKFVYNSLPDSIKKAKRCIINPYGAPKVISEDLFLSSGGKVKFLFAGSMSQRKGLADLLQAFRMSSRKDIELIILGKQLMPMSFYRSIYPDFKHIQSCSNQQVLEIMHKCDVFVLPSIIEGRALVQLEALSAGLPLIITPNTGGFDLIDEGKTGFFVPIRSPESILDRINWFADNRSILLDMKKMALSKAKSISWEGFRSKIVEVIKELQK